MPPRTAGSPGARCWLPGMPRRAGCRRSAGATPSPRSAAASWVSVAGHRPVPAIPARSGRHRWPVPRRWEASRPGAPDPWCSARSVAPSRPHVTNYRGLMRVYHERLRVPLSWWVVGLATIAILATEVIPGWPLPVQVAIYVVLVGGFATVLLNWGRPSVDVGAGELRVGAARLPLTAVGEVTALDEAQTRSLRGPRGDPAAFLFIRPYLRQSVYVEVTTQAAAIPPAATSG